MAPFSMQCKTCGEFIYKGKKFNARKEFAHGEDYLGIQIFRFYIACPLCASEITFKTDPQNTDYTCEHGATRNYEPWREETRVHQEMKEDRLKMEEDSPMLGLENKTMDSKREMEILDALDEIRAKNAILEKVDKDKILDKIYSVPTVQEQRESDQIAEFEQIARKVFTDADGDTVKRISKKPIFHSSTDAKPPSFGSAASKDSAKDNFVKPLVKVGMKKKQAAKAKISIEYDSSNSD